jgi:transposase
LSRSFKDVGDELGCSSKTIKNLFADCIIELESARTLECPEVLGIDGVCVGRHKSKRSYCLLTDIAEHRIVELLPKSTELELARFLKQVPHPERLKIVVIDMSLGFLTVVRKIFPWARVVIDAYHVLRMVNDAVTEVLKAIQENLDEAGREALMHEGNRFLLLKRRFELTEEQNEQLQRWFERVPELKQAYELKEEIYDIWRLSERTEAEKRYDTWLTKIPKEMQQAFKKFTGAVRRWRPYIFNYFDSRVTNAYTESRNRDIKTLQRLGRRTSFQVLRARLLYGDTLRKPHSSGDDVTPQQVRSVLKESKHRRRLLSVSRDPHSYLARIDAARKSRNEFSKLMCPPTSWVDRFGHYSRYSDEESPVKWDFIW